MDKVTPMMDDSELSTLLISAIQHQNDAFLDDLLCGDGKHLIDTFDRDGNTLLHISVAKNDLQCVKTLLKHGANPNIFDTMKARTPMHLATELGNHDIVKLFLESSQVNLDTRDDRNLTPEEIAQFCDNQTILTLIRTKQTEIYERKKELYSFLDDACSKNEPTQFSDLVKNYRNSFLEQGLKTNESAILADATIKDLINWAPKNSVTLLFKAASLGHTQICRILIELGATGKSVPTTNYSPLYVATYGGFNDTMKLLLDNFPTQIQQVTIEKWLPLHIACIKNHSDSMKLLLSYPYHEKLKRIFISRSGLYEYRFAFDLNAQDAAGQTVIYLASLSNNQKILDTLLQFRLPAKLRLQNQSDTANTSHLLSSYQLKESSSISKVRHVKIVQNNSISNDDSNLRNQFVPNKQLDNIIRRLHKLDKSDKGDNNKDLTRSTCLICPFEIDTYCNHNSESALHVAVCKQYHSIASTLLVNGANPNLPILSKETVKGDNSSPNINPSDSVISNKSHRVDAGLNWFKSAKSTCLREACHRHDVTMVELLIKYGARDDDNIALQTAASDNDIVLLSKLLALGGNIDPEYKINRRSKIEFHNTNHSGKPSSSTVTTFSSMFPTSAVMIDWHGLKCLKYIESQWLINAALSHNKKLSINHQAISVAAITRLDLSGNNLKTINPLIFKLPSLRELNLSQNKLEILPVEYNSLIINEDTQDSQKQENQNIVKPLAMKRSKSLTASLSQNTSMPNSNSHSWELPCLEILDLHDNRLLSLPLCLFQLPKLGELDVSSNQIRQLPWTLWSAPLLREFNASGNLLHDLPQRYSPRQNTTEYHSCKQLPRTTENNRRLSTSTNESISIRFSDLDVNRSAVSENFNSSTENNSLDGNLKVITTDLNINHLNHWSNKVDVISSALPVGSPINNSGSDNMDTESSNYKQECKLNHINLSFNSFTSIPPVLACVASELVRLNLSHNRMESLGNIHEYPSSLKNLDLSCNQISSWFTTPDDDNNYFDTNCFNNEVYLDLVSSNSPSGKTQFSVSNQSSYLKGFCVHKFHERLENLKSLNLSHNRFKLIAISSVDLFNTSEQSGRQYQQRDFKNTLLFPHLTILDMSFNSLVKIPSNISELVDLSVLNLSGNPTVCVLPPEMGLLGKLWNLGLNGCNLSHPLKSMIESKSYKTMDIVGYLRSILEEARSYARMKLMLVGIQGIGKTSLLEQMRFEGTMSNRKRAPPEHWTKRMGHGSISNMKTPKGVTLSTVGVDIHDWVFCKKVARGQSTFGPVTFSTWDFGGQQEFYATHRYFLSKRSMYLVVWRLTDGQDGIDGIQQWLVNIQSRAPGSPVIIVGTHEDLIEGGEQGERANELQAQIKQRFINIVDQDKCGFPKIVDNIVVSTKTKLNIRNLCNKIYDIVFSLRCPGSMERLLEQKIPATYLYLEEIVVWLANERRKSRKDPVMFYDEYKSTIVGLMRNKYQKSFRDLEPLSSREINHNSELQQATRFLHENGILLHYEDANLRDLYFLDPQWLCDILSHVVTIREINPYAKNGLMKIDDLNYLFKSVDVNLSGGIQSYIVNLLNKFEVALTWNSRYLLLPSLLPSEEHLRRGVSPCEVKISSRVRGRSAIRRWHPTQQNNNRSASIDSSKYHQINQQLSKTNVNFEQQPDRSLYRLIMLRYLPAGFFARLQSCILSDMSINDIVGSLFSEIPVDLEQDPVISSLIGSSASWTCWQSGLCLHLDCQTISNDSTSSRKVSYLQNKSSNFILRIRESPISHPINGQHQRLARYMIYSSHSQSVYKSEHPIKESDQTSLDSTAIKDWSEYDPRQFTSIIEVHLPYWRMAIRRQDNEATIDYVELNPQCIAKLLSTIVDHIDNLLEDWYPSLGTRFVHTSEGKYLVTRIVSCPQCEYEFRNEDDQQQQQQPYENTRDKKNSNPGNESKIKFSIDCLTQTQDYVINHNDEVKQIKRIYCYYVEQCILNAYNLNFGQDYQTSKLLAHVGGKKQAGIKPLRCPNHGELQLDRIAPDIVFCDVGTQYIVDGESIHRCKLIGRGAYGLVFRGTLQRLQHSLNKGNTNMVDMMDRSSLKLSEIAMKMLQPIDPGPDADQADIVAYKSSKTNWQREPLQCACKAYCTARQELNILLTLRHPHIVPFVGLSIKPLAVILELAPFGSLEDIFKGYRRAGMRINSFCMQKIILQVARALEYLHQQRVIYRDLKSENVLVWDFPSPFATRSSSNNVNVKLADYGISRLALPTGIKGFGGTIGFLAPEILRHNGDEEYTEKVDCFSFGMFIYELITLHPPFDHLESIKGHVIDGGRPSLSPRDLIYPSYLMDLMTVCWSQEPSNRPTASQIVSIASCPEFVQLQDVVALDGKYQFLHGVAVQIMETDDTKVELWLARQSNKTDILSANQSQWYSYKQLQLNSFNRNSKLKSSSPFQITCTCLVEDRLWLCDARMTIHIMDLNQNHHSYSSFNSTSKQFKEDTTNNANANKSTTTTTMNTIDSFSLDMIKSDIIMSYVQSMVYVRQANSVLILTNLGQLWLCQLSTMHTRRLDDGSVTYLCISVQEYHNDNRAQHQQHVCSGTTNIESIRFNIWCGHNSSISCLEIVNYEINRQNILPLAGKPIDLSGERIVEPSQPTDIKFIVASMDNNLWTAAGCTVHLWSLKDKCVARKLDCWKLVPCSESLDSISIENHHDEARQSHVSSIAILNNQLYVGTSHGCLMIVEANTLKPITVFRPFEADLRILIPNIRCNINWGDSVSNPDSGIETRDNLQEEPNYIITIGSQYRNVINRYVVSLETEEANKIGLGCDAAILWSANNWMID